MQELIIQDASGLFGSANLCYNNGAYEVSQVRDGKRQCIRLSPLQAWKVKDGIEDMECVRGAVQQEIFAEKSAQVVDPMKGGE